MVPPTPQEAVDEWVVKVGSENKVEALNDTRSTVMHLKFVIFEALCFYIL